MRCDEVMTAEVVTLSTTETVLDAATKMRDLEVGFLPVCNPDGAVVGTLTDRDIVLRAVAEKLPPTTRVEELMTTRVVAVRPDEELRRAEELMRQHRINRIVVVGDDGRVAGVVSIADVAQQAPEDEAGRLYADVSGREVSPH
jgi:CBS domain-containing protein